jgi:hypothetical protein
MAVYGGPDIVTDGLVLHLDAANTKSYPGSGNVWTDLINNQNITISNLHSFDNNIALRVKNRAFATIPFTFNDQMTFEIWYRTYTEFTTTNIFAGSPPIMQIGNYNSNTSITLWHRILSSTSRNNTTLINNGNTWTGSINTGATTNSAWLKYHQICMVFSGNNNWSNYKLYIDKILVTNWDFPNPTNTIGGGNNLFLTGASGSQPSLDNSYSVVRIYNSALGLTDLEKNYEAHKGRFGL